MKLNSLLREDLSNNIYLSSQLSPDDIKNVNGSLQAIKKLIPWDDNVQQFQATDLDLTSIEGSPTKCLDYFSVRRNTRLRNLVGGPTQSPRYFANDCGLTSLEGAPLYCAMFNVASNAIPSLEGIGRKYLKIGGKLIISRNPLLRSHILGLLLVKELETIEYEAIMTPDPVNKTTPFRIIQEDFIWENDHDIMSCKEILIAKGFKEFAKL